MYCVHLLMLVQLFLVEAGPLQPHPPAHAAIPFEAIKTSRTAYKNLFLEKMRAPDGGYEEGVIIPGTNESPPRTERSGGNLDQNNPLSLHNEVRYIYHVDESALIYTERILGRRGLRLWTSGRLFCKMLSERMWIFCLEKPPG